MLFFENFARAKELGYSALRDMEQHSVAANPNNYTIWYMYESGRDPELSRTIESLLASQEGLTPERTEELYSKFFGTGHGEDLVNRTSDEITGALQQLLEHVGEAGDDASRYSQQLHNFTGDLAHAGSKEELRALVSGVLRETRNMQQRNKKLEERLSDSSSHINDLSQRLEDVRREALTDALTGIANRKAFDLSLQTCVNSTIEDGENLCLVMVDIDHFKGFNDQHGHQMGDQVLRLIGHTLKLSVKGQDTPARYGGEEFAIILPNTKLADAVVLAERIRKTVANKRVTKKNTGEALGKITLSLGVAQLRPGEPLSDLISRADEALYAAKRGGRNQVVSEEIFEKILAAG